MFEAEAVKSVKALLLVSAIRIDLHLIATKLI